MHIQKEDLDLPIVLKLELGDGIGIRIIIPHIGFCRSTSVRGIGTASIIGRRPRAVCVPGKNAIGIEGWRFRR
jgi:hypothetical protein